jgi:hypothetical protein
MARRKNAFPSYNDRMCEECHREELNPDTMVMLELDQRIGEYHDIVEIPEEWNQGGFRFGPGCAKKCRERARKELKAQGLI